MQTVWVFLDPPEILGTEGAPLSLQADEVNYDVGPFCQDAQVVADGTVAFTCNSAAQPAADLTWTLPSGDEVTAGETVGDATVDEDGVLRVHVKDTDGAGTYRCKASNYAGMDSESCVLSIIS